ncbi:NPC intracellular cholesterol transporter 1-like isoform X2 [Tetranychus urticae]|uniref:NPC intracellular cholesterol transporter 1-like isoform X2 n=1 Tax=Tetranychus urticae TaxID=32264 RepID=UPI000D647277|nr:NPC intracellular cholesterol transporter 1-like isoform X2 [Tetranychus urticae]
MSTLINYLILTVLHLLLISLNNYVYCDCIFRSTCDDIQNKFMLSLKIPCVYNGAPQFIPNEATLHSLHEICPYLDQVNNPTLCCDQEQIDILIDQLALPRGMLGRCPSCFYNFANFLCHMTCSPKQSEFLRLDEAKPSEKYPEKQQVSWISYAIEEEFAQTLFNSCVNVLAPGANFKPVQLMCDQWGDQCNAHRLLESIGMNDSSPFGINFHYFPDSVATSISPLQLSSTQCFERPGVPNKTACSCSDCPTVCKPLPRPEAHERFCILGTDGMTIVMSCVFIITTTAFTIYYTYYQRKTNFIKDETMVNLKSSTVSNKGIGSRLEKFLEHSFRQWGYIVTSRPTLTIIIGAVSILITGFEFANISSRITSDPVELWSSPESHARQDKLFFDTNFGPFYRVNQLIIKKTTNEPNFDYYANDKNYLFNPIFDKEFLLKTLELQRELTSLKAVLDGQTVELTDICFSPLANGKCAVQSVIGWFQTNVTRLEDDPVTNYSYLDHIISCLGNPFAPDDNLKPFHYPCLGEYGGPALPKVALGGFNIADSQKDAADAYTQATSLVITILINNHADKSQNKKAEAWEQVFLDYLHSFNHTRFPDFDIAYFSENLSKK